MISLGSLELIKIYIFAFNAGIIVRQRTVPFILFFIVTFLIELLNIRNNYFNNEKKNNYLTTKSITIIVLDQIIIDLNNKYELNVVCKDPTSTNQSMMIQK